MSTTKAVAAKPRLASPQAGQTLYAQGTSQENSLFTLSELWVDLNSPAFVTNGSAGQALWSGVPYEIHGDWLYVDRSSVGCPQITLYGENDDSKSFAAHPGALIQTAFDRIRVFSGQAYVGTPPLNESGVLNPGMRIFYGTGTCPFIPTGGELGSTHPIDYTVNTFSTSSPTAAVTTAVLIPEGAMLDVYTHFLQTTSAANTSILRAMISLNSPYGEVGIIQPDYSEINDVTTAAAGVTARTISTFRNVRATRHAYYAQIRAFNYGTEATNNIAQGYAGVTWRIK